MKIFIGTIVIGISILLLFNSIFLLYRYLFTDTLFLFMYPIWVLFIDAFLGTLGIYISILLTKEKLGFRIYLLLFLLILLFTLASYVLPVVL